MTPERERQVIEAYENWDPQEQTVDELCREIGVTRTTLYNTLARNGVALKTRGGAGRSRLTRENAGDILDLMAQTALDTLFTKLRDAQDYAAQLEAAILTHSCPEDREVRSAVRDGWK